MLATTAKVDLWRSRLLDTTRRNRLLYFKPTKQTVQITSPSAGDLFNDLVSRGQHLDFPYPVEEISIVLVEEEDEPDAPPQRVVRGQLETPLTPAELSRGLYKLRLKTHASITEQGVNT